MALHLTLVSHSQTQFIPRANVCILFTQSGEGGKVAETMRQQRQGDYTVMGLQLNIEQMMDYMEVKGLSGHLALFRCEYRYTVVGPVHGRGSLGPRVGSPCCEGLSQLL